MTDNPVYRDDDPRWLAGVFIDLGLHEPSLMRINGGSAEALAAKRSRAPTWRYIVQLPADEAAAILRAFR